MKPGTYCQPASYTASVADFEEGGRLLARVGETTPEGSIKIRVALQVVPRVFEEAEEIRVYYSLNTPGTTWGVAG